MSSVMKSTRGSKSEAISNYSDITDRSTPHREPEILWPEWSDTEINVEKWGPPIKSDVAGKGKSPSNAKESKGKNTSRLDNSTGKIPIEAEQFEDPYPVELAWSLHKGHPIYWQRPSVVFPDTKLVVRSDSAPTCPDLITSNRKILRSEFIRSFMSSIQILTYIGYQHPFEIEWQSIQFTSNTRNLPWEPWHHVYSIGRAGGTSSHNPVCNTLGKYAVRLFWLGCWRKIFVDDRVPVNAAGKPLLPTTTIENTNELELWPILLTKALMKIASLSWTDQLELVDFDIITCLTGWAVQKLNIKGLDLSEKWDICSSYSNHFTWDKKYLKEEEPVVQPPPKAKDAKDAKKSKKEKTEKAEAKPENTIDFHLVGTLADLRYYSDILEDITPCWSHSVLLEATRSIPLVKNVSDITDDFASWKEFRWIDWAIAHGLWEPDFTLENKQFIKVISSLRKVLGNNTIDLETSYTEKCIKNSVEAYAEFFEMRELGKFGKKPNTASSQTKEKPKKASKPPKPTKTIKVTKAEKFVDPSIWCYFKKIGEYIHSLSIYIKPSSFSSRCVLTNFRISGSPLKKGAKKDDRKSRDDKDDSYKHILWENVLQKSRNDTMYLFTDSIDFRLTVFTLAHIGKEFPECQKEANASTDLFPTECTKAICVTDNCPEDCNCQKRDSVESIDSNFIDRRRTASIIVEDYDWKSRQTGEMSMFLKTYGTSSLFFNFARGRHVKRIWMNAEPAFCLHIFSDDPNIKIGKCDEILEYMAMESQLLTNKTFDLCAAFGRLVQFFATADYPQALRLFYKSYLPDNVQLSKKNAARIHNVFLTELKVILAENYPEMFHYDMSRAVRVLLLDPNFRIPYIPEFDTFVPPNSELKLDNSCPCEDVKVISDKDKEMAATKIQSIFKMDYMKRLKDNHNYNNNNLPRLIECIKSIYMDIFSTKTRDSQCMKLFRAMLFNKEIKDLVPNYFFWKDLKSVIDLKLFTGDANEIKHLSFIPFFKRCFFCIDDEVYMRPYLYSSLRTTHLRVFDNDTEKEIERYTNNTLVHKYVKNKKGYTILAYGISNLGVHSKSHNWKLLIASEKIFLNSAIDIEQQVNSSALLDGFYNPNLDNLICKIKLKVNQNCRGTFHLQASSPSARMKMECITAEGNVLAEAYGMSTVMIPIVNIIIESDYQVLQEVTIVEKNNKITKKMKSQRRVSSKSLTIKDRKRLEKESTISIQPALSSKKKAFSLEHRPSFEYKEFFIKVFVLENSWPLTITEWNVVKLVREQANVEPELFPVKPLAPRASKKLHTPRRGSKLKEMNLTKPFWIFTSYNDGPAKNMSFTIDTSRSEEIKEIKKQIILDDVPRYFEGKEKRQEFLEKSYIHWTPVSSPSKGSLSDNSLLAYLENTVKDIQKQAEPPIETVYPATEEKKSICRTCQKEIDPYKFEYLKAPESIHKMLPPFDYNKQHEKMNEDRWTIDGKREKELFENMYDEIDNFDETNNINNEAVDRIIYESKRNYSILNKWYKEIREQSQEMMLRNDNKREYYKEKLKDELKSIKDAAKDSKDAKKKSKK